MDKIIFREPRISDVKSGLEMINSLVDEKAYLIVQKKKTLTEERSNLKDRLKRIKEKTRVELSIEIDKKLYGNAKIVVPDNRIPRKHVGELGISLSKEIRGKGLGEKLIKKIIEKAAKELKIKIVMLYVFKENKVAINLYKKMGFKKLGTIKNGISYYGRFTDNNIMVKYL